jgi:putative tricarboxylic transport membrane protein
MTDRIILACILVLAGIYFWATTQIPTLEIGDPLGPKAFPRLLGVGLLITAAMLLGEIMTNRKAERGAKTPSTAEAKEEGNTKVVVAAVVASAIFFVLFEPVGYVITTTAYLVVMTYVFHKKGIWMTNVLTSVIYGVGSYFAFTKLLGVNLPRGILPF